MFDQGDQRYIVYGENRSMICWAWAKNSVPRVGHRQVDQCYILYGENRYMLSGGMGKEISTISCRTHGQVDHCYDYCARGKGIDA